MASSDSFIVWLCKSIDPQTAQMGFAAISALAVYALYAEVRKHV